MTEKCGICEGTINLLFLEKIRGTFMKNKKGKKVAICADCQKKHSPESLREKIQ